VTADERHRIRCLIDQKARERLPSGCVSCGMPLEERTTGCGACRKRHARYLQKRLRAATGTCVGFTQAEHAQDVYRVVYRARNRYTRSQQNPGGDVNRASLPEHLLQQAQVHSGSGQIDR
jgi:hypothetical protein